MSISITEKILSSNKFYTDKYLKDTLNLTKSILMTNSKEATLYNEYIENNYTQHSIDYTDKTTWRYYKHLSAQYHSLDTPITLISIDNGETITLSPESLLLHRITHTELLKYDLFYKETVDRYPEQELYIRSTISTSPKYSIQDIIKSEDFTIIGYNKRLVEENEDDLIFHLQDRINNYKVTKLIQYYSLTDNLFIASQYHILYTFIFKTLLALRLSNAKTLRAHSYHILNYLSSHHYLDIHHSALTKKQSLYLYRNLLYLNNHSGQDNIFKTLIDKLFTERNISVVNYTYTQSNSTLPSNHMEYRFKQKLLNNANLVYSYQDYELEDILQKEAPLTLSNPDHIKFNTPSIDLTYKNELYNTLLTKDIETITVDNTDTVKYKLIPTIIDYWAYLLYTNQMRFLASVLDPVSNQELRLSTRDLFKLYTIVLYKLNHQELTQFQPYLIQRVYKSTLPTKETLLNYFYRKHYYHSPLIDQILYAIPPYNTTITSYQFEQFVTSIYKLNIGLWLFTSNLHDKDDEGQFDNLISNLHTYHLFTFNDETPEDFLKRLNLENLFTYPQEALEDLSFSIVNNVFDNRLSFLNKYKYIQQSLIEIFKKFNSYTVQLIDNYSQYSPILAGPSEPRVTLEFDKHTNNYFFDSIQLNVEMQYITKHHKEVHFKNSITANEVHTKDYILSLDSGMNIAYNLNSNIRVLFNTPFINDIENTDWMVTESSDEDKLFLAYNT